MNKKPVLLILFLLLVMGLTGCLRTEGEPIAVAAENFINLLDQGKFENAVKFFDETMKRELSAADLEQAWLSLVESKGHFLQQEYKEVVDFDFHRVIRIKGIFQMADAEFRITFNEAGEIAGLYIK